MSQASDLIPRTVYVPRAAFAEAEQRATDLSVSVGVVLRLILLGKQQPLTGK